MSTSAALRVAVITPYFREPLEQLEQCCRSVQEQTYPCTHFLVSDGSPWQQVRGWPGEHILLPRPHADGGNTPRGIGAISAIKLDYDAIAFLDADNWFYPSHVQAMVELHQRTGAAVCTATRTMHRPDGSLMYTDTVESNGREAADTSCQFITREAFLILPLWAALPKQLGAVGDGVLWSAIRARRYTTAHCTEATVAFRTLYALHYERLGETPPANAKTLAQTTLRSKQWWDALPAAERQKLNRMMLGK
jgi:hypothetical protein